MLLFLLACGGSGGHGHHDDHATVTHRFDDVDKWTKVFDDPERDAWQKPAEIVKVLDLKPGMAVAEIGAGTGYMNRHLAAAVGPSGHVVAIDVEKTLVDHMQKRATEEGTPQVTARLTTASESGLHMWEVDRVLLLDTYHHISSRREYFTKVGQQLKPGGMLLIIDFKPGDIPVGPPEDHRIPAEKIEEELTAVGWRLIAAPDPLPYQFVRQFAWTKGSRQDREIAVLAKARDAGPIVLIDVRTPKEFASGRVPGAVNQPMGTPMTLPSKDEPIWLICESGGRSARKAAELQEQGYSVINVLGGTGAWRRAGLPLEK